jgi:5'-3' exoribonuclease 2
MGVPAFYRWLSEKYPKIVEDVLEERVKLVSNDGSMRLPFDSTRPNPSKLETDNLYIDMNGIIHPCSHPEVGPQPTTEAEMYENVCKYVDRLVRTVRPRKLLYLAIDGVAPRAKMNQQRSRRFRSAQEARDHAELEEHIRQELVKAGQGVPPSKKPWDSNVITPGTPFMLNLATHVRFYIRKRISTDKAWKNIVVIFSDASLPGEGEHKIMEHVRLQRSQPGYNPNTVHVLHGLDADLIMLALATHEMHFYILREVVTFGRKSLEQMEQRQLESGFQDAQRHLDEEAGPQAMSLPENQQKPLQRVSIPILREYLANEFASCLAPGALPFAPSLERLIDDVVFLCFFVGNDFLPHLPSLDIRDGALDFLFNVYKRVLPTFGDFITSHGGQVNLSHVDVILAEVGAIEDYVFAMKHSNEEREQQRREEMKERRKSGQKPDAPPVVAAASVQPLIGRTAKILEKRKREHGEEQTVALGRGHVTKEEARKDLKAKKMVAEANAQAALELKKSLLGARADKKEIKLEVTETKSEEMDIDSSVVKQEEEVDVDDMTKKEGSDELGMKRKLEEIESDSAIKAENENRDQRDMMSEEEAEFEDDVDGDDNDADEEDEVEEIIEEEAEKVEVPAEIDPELAKAFKEKIKLAKAKQLDEFSKNVEDKVRLHEKGWKVRLE